MELRVLFMEVSDKLEKNYFKEGINDSLKEKLDLRKVDETKDTNKIMFSHQEHCPKYISRCTGRRVGQHLRIFWAFKNKCYLIIS